VAELTEAVDATDDPRLACGPGREVACAATFVSAVYQIATAGLNLTPTTLPTQVADRLLPLLALVEAKVSCLVDELFAGGWDDDEDVMDAAQFLTGVQMATQAALALWTPTRQEESA